ncbi:hypothetical protein TPHA_0G02520 [Tetrapisispora phaffii CBS 4417]|uniref:Vacuolar ATPase assembly integral membrane protein VPH2 n=1 Tax=Tetrapisispora phaffii (strain ATCC 24235 / CBS 4417 / NBRC 1672 / NRRL Y-8282 / UCD 70-5) TaxID=1071381 RepID=G8BW09_TETPH|nr:hypothetical protein TPHA_0G02520 [Tetrapisispora phaffii CBS 4417]CCE64087.1 hypothetical protein TPHA_0G02520 [Tetrapisispora phaffii CBS 4417]
MFDIKLNTNIRNFLVSITSSSNNIEITEIIEQDYISIDALKDIYKSNKSTQPKISLKELLTPLEFQIKEKHVRGSHYTDEFKKQLNYLKLKNEEDDYQNMIKKSNLQSKAYDDDYISPAQMNKQIKEQVTTVFNIIISVLSVIAAIWYWTKSSMVVSPEYRILLCLFFGILVLVAEVVVYNSYLNKIETAKTTERAKKEKISVIERIVI